MRIDTTSKAAVLTLCLSLAASAAFAGDAPAAPPAQQAPAAGAPVPPNTSDSADAGEARLQARTYAAQVRDQAAMEAAREREETVRQAEETAERREETARQREDALRAQMDAARRRLEVAAQQLAALSGQMYGPMMQRVETALVGPPHVLLGVQLDDSGDSAGARVREVSPGGAAEQAGMRPGDRIVAVNGTSVQGREPALRVVELLHDVKPGDKVALKVSRDGKTRDVTVTARPIGNEFFIARQMPDLPHMPALPSVPSMPRVPALPAWGGAPMIFRGPVADLELARLTPGLGSYFGTVTGVLVVRAPPAGGLGLQDGDVILSIAGRKPIDSSHVIRILSSYDPGEKITLEVMRRHRRISVATTLPAEPPLPRKMLEIRQGAFSGPGPVVRTAGTERTR